MRGKGGAGDLPCRGARGTLPGGQVIPLSFPLSQRGGVVMHYIARKDGRIMDKPAAASEGKGLKIIGAGFGRTGTMSLKVALEELGFSPCYHMIEVFERPADIAVWEGAAVGKPIDWEALFAGYQATVDWPACIFYKELMQVYPDAKVLLTVRNPENWYESANSTIFQMRTRRPPISEQIRARVPDMQQFGRMINAII